jgi:TPR repeat protein
VARQSYFKLSADQVIVAAQFQYGLQLSQSDSISMNQSHAASYVRFAADQGHMNARS